MLVEKCKIGQRGISDAMDVDSKSQTDISVTGMPKFQTYIHNEDLMLQVFLFSLPSPVQEITDIKQSLNRGIVQNDHTEATNYIKAFKITGRRATGIFR